MSIYQKLDFAIHWWMRFYISRIFHLILYRGVTSYWWSGRIFYLCSVQVGICNMLCVPWHSGHRFLRCLEYYSNQQLAEFKLRKILVRKWLRKFSLIQNIGAYVLILKYFQKKTDFFPRIYKFKLCLIIYFYLIYLSIY